VRNLHVTLHRDGQPILALRGVDLEIAPGEIVALVGESGSGKSTLGLAIQGLLPAESQPLVTGSIQLNGVEVVGAAAEQLRHIRREHLGAIFQDPMTSLNPSMRIGRQLLENVRDHSSPSPWLERVGIDQPEQRARSYPHQLSGGQRQRVMIAMALAGYPGLIIADEPTTALDVTVQAQVLRLMAQLGREEQIAFLFVTHDLTVAATIADRIAVLYAGQVVEIGPIRQIMATPAHPYTTALLEARFGLHADKQHQLPTLSGEPPAPGHWPSGCAFAPRCLLAVAECRQMAPALAPVSQHQGAAACWRAAKVSPHLWIQLAQPWPDERRPSQQPLLKMTAVYKSFPIQRRSWWGQAERLQALRGVDLTLAQGESVALVGESGSGKSTLLRIAAGLIQPDRGEVWHASSERPQMVFQDAIASLTPWLRVEELVGERLRRQGLSQAERRQRIQQALDWVGLPAQVAQALPMELSGGQAQRVAIARAIVVPPKLLLCDEPVSAMDVSLAAAILNLLVSLQRQLKMAMLFVTHDLAAARFVADRVVVLKAGLLVEGGPADTIIHTPQHPYTQELLAAMPDHLVEGL
jgi:peptide/nickel transport system ATP-binding protein